MATKKLCDMCGCEIKPKETGRWWAKARPKKFMGFEVYDYDAAEYSFDLCEECANAVIAFIKVGVRRATD